MSGKRLEPQTAAEAGLQVAELVLPGASDTSERPDVSVIVPVTERPESLDGIYEQYSRAIDDSGRSYEFLFVVEPYRHGSLEALRPLAEAGEPIRVIEAGHPVGESTLLKLGASRVAGHVLVVLPAYHRVVPDALPRLVERVEEGADLANARRWPRRDSWLNRVQTRMLHGLVSPLSRGRLHDVGSGVRALRPEVLREMPLYGDFFRFLPVLALRDGYSVVEVDAEQHPMDAKLRVYSPGTYLRRAIDVFGLFFLSRFTYKPLRFFGLIGSVLSGVGGVLLVVMLIQRLGGQGLANRPLLLLAVLLFTLGVQAVALGLIGEIIVHFNAPTRRPYRVAGENDPATGGNGTGDRARSGGEDAGESPGGPASRGSGPGDASADEMATK
ncbi:MAG: glycosyltransferase [Gemmatimonadota bacterium]